MIPLLAVLLSSTPAQAAEWSDLGALFPVSACSDGWVGCMVGSTRVDPEPRVDTRGTPMPSDLRVSWFTLEGDATFDPFARLSVYAPNPTELVAAVDPHTTTPGNLIATPENLTATPGTVTAPPGNPTTSPPTTTPIATPPTALVTPPTTTPIGVPPTTLPPPKTLVPATGLPPTTVVPPPSTLTKNPIATGPSNACGLTNDLERRSMLGKLTADDRTCLETLTSATGTRATQRSKTSRILIADAFAQGEKEEWARLAKRHLDEIERSDPNIAFAYATYLYRKGQTESVLYWANVALDNRTQWTGDNYTRRTLAMRSIKARAAGKRWQQLATAEAELTTASDGKAEKWRIITVTESREWYDTAVAMGKPSTTALALCQSASGTDDACR